MNKLFTLTALGLLVSLSATAQKVRKSWDFRQGFSTATVANLAADMEQNGLPAVVQQSMTTTNSVQLLMASTSQSLKHRVLT